MSKYIDLMLALNKLWKLCVEDIDAEISESETFDFGRARDALADLPTIEVSEDAISREWVLKKIDECYDETQYACNLAVALEREVKSAPSVIPKPKEGEWIPCSERLPEACQEVQLTCEVRPVGREPFRYVCVAEWIPRFCQEARSVNWDDETTEYCEEDDEYYPLEGWYERIRNWNEYSLVGVADFEIAWKPLEEPYKGADNE